MAKIKLGFDTSEADSGFENIDPGLYVAKVAKVELSESSAGNPMLVVSLKLTKDKINAAFKGATIRTWVALTKAADFKVRELQEAVGLKPGKTIDPDEVEGATVQVRIKSGSYNGEARSEVGKLLPMPKSNDDDDDEEDEEETEPPEEADEEEGDDDDEEESDEEEGEPEDDYDDWTLDELKAELKDRVLKTAGKKSVLIARLRKDDEAEVEDDDEDEDDPF